MFYLTTALYLLQGSGLHPYHCLLYAMEWKVEEQNQISQTSLLKQVNCQLCKTDQNIIENNYYLQQNGVEILKHGYLLDFQLDLPFSKTKLIKSSKRFFLRFSWQTITESPPQKTRWNSRQKKEKERRKASRLDLLDFSAELPKEQLYLILPF